MHWVLVRLLRLFPPIPLAREMRAALDADLTTANLATEAGYIEAHRGFERPYGLGWALMLADELRGWEDPDATRWRDAMGGLEHAIRAGFLAWLPKQTYPLRIGLHPNSAFGLSLALGFARSDARDGRPELKAAIRDAAMRWFANDADYPAAWEPSGADFLSPALAEAELMCGLLDGRSFRAWLDKFLPTFPRSLMLPAFVSDPTDGQIAHLHGLNLSRAYCMRRIREALAGDDRRIPPLDAAIESHVNASLAAAVGGDYMVEHWLPAYALLLLS